MKREVDEDKDIKPLCFVVLAGPREPLVLTVPQGKVGWRHCWLHWNKEITST